MQELLTIKLRNYLAVHYPDRLLTLAEEGKEEVYIRERVEGVLAEMEAMLDAGTPAYMVEIHCMDVLITSLGPSKYDYIYNILEEEFEERFTAFEGIGILLYEIVNIIHQCGELLNDFDEYDQLLQYQVIGIIGEYFVNPETVSHGV